MAHFAQLDENNQVIKVLVVNDDYLKDENGNEVEELGQRHMELVHGGKWVQTSYNNNIRVRYAGRGMIYDETLDAFIPPKPYPSWVIDETTVDWKAPIPYPDDDQYPDDDHYYEWNEEIISWDLIPSDPVGVATT